MKLGFDNQGTHTFCLHVVLPSRFLGSGCEILMLVLVRYLLLIGIDHVRYLCDILKCLLPYIFHDAGRSIYRCQYPWRVRSALSLVEDE